MKNLAIPENGGSIHSFTSQYHHESRCSNLMNRDKTLVWFSHINEPLPQSVVIKLGKRSLLKKIGIYVHGENNQNPKHLEIYVSDDAENFQRVIDEEIEQKAGDFLYDVPNQSVEANYVKFTITENYGGSGIHIAAVEIYGYPIDSE